MTTFPEKFALDWLLTPVTVKLAELTAFALTVVEVNDPTDAVAEVTESASKELKNPLVNRLALVPTEDTAPLADFSAVKTTPVVRSVVVVDPVSIVHSPVDPTRTASAEKSTVCNNWKTPPVAYMADTNEVADPIVVAYSVVV